MRCPDLNARQILGSIAVFGLAALCLPAPAHAQFVGPFPDWENSAGVLLRPLGGPIPDWDVSLEMGVAAEPLYEGSNVERLWPAPDIDVRYKDIAFLSLGDGIGVNLLRGDNYRAGLALAWDMGRQHNLATRLSGTGNVDPTPQARAFAEVAVLPVIISADLRQSLIGSQGLTFELGTYMPVYGSEQLVVFLGPSVTVADTRYMQAYFGISPQHAAPHSIFQPYNAQGGLKSVNFGAVTVYHFRPQWFIDADLGVERLLGSAANSPIVQDKYQVAASVGLGYTF